MEMQCSVGMCIHLVMDGSGIWGLLKWLWKIRMWGMTGLTLRVSWVKAGKRSSCKTQYCHAVHLLLLTQFSSQRVTENSSETFLADWRMTLGSVDRFLYTVAWGQSDWKQRITRKQVSFWLNGEQMNGMNYW